MRNSGHWNLGQEWRDAVYERVLPKSDGESSSLKTGFAGCAGQTGQKESEPPRHKGTKNCPGCPLGIPCDLGVFVPWWFLLLESTQIDVT